MSSRIYKRVGDLAPGDLVICEPARPDKIWEIVAVEQMTAKDNGWRQVTRRTVTADGQELSISRAAFVEGQYRMAGPIQAKRYRASLAS